MGKDAGLHKRQGGSVLQKRNNWFLNIIIINNLINRLLDLNDSGLKLRILECFYTSYAQCIYIFTKVKSNALSIILDNRC